MEENRITVEFENADSLEEIAAARLQDQQFARNRKWLHEHIVEVADSHRGKTVCVAGEQLFVGNSAAEAVAKARAAHPHEQGWFVRYIYQEKAARIYDLSR